MNRIPVRIVFGRSKGCDHCKAGFAGRLPHEDSEQALEITDPETGEILLLRRTTVELDKPTRDGKKAIHPLTNLPPEIDAIFRGDVALGMLAAFDPGAALRLPQDTMSIAFGQKDKKHIIQP